MDNHSSPGCGRRPCDIWAGSMSTPAGSPGWRPCGPGGRNRPMLVIEQVIGNRYDDQQLAEDCQRAAETGGLEHIHLSLDEAVRGRMRVTTDGGTEVGIAVGRDHALRDGDVLYRSDDGQRVVVVTMRAAETLVI